MAVQEVRPSKVRRGGYAVRTYRPRYSSRDSGGGEGLARLITRIHQPSVIPQKAVQSTFIVTGRLVVQQLTYRPRRFHAP